ncbi:MAG: glycosyltransferase [Prolixibacteraceae bacterium]|nr:glycosyltransferase [Prolixibacteraceae bacterium]
MYIIIAGSAHPFRGGLASFNERLATEIQKQGNRVRIETFSLQYPSFLFPGKTQYSSSPPPENLEIVTSINSINPFNWIKTGLKIKKAKPDLLIFKFWLPFMGPCFGTIARIAKRNKHTKVITILDNLIPHEKRPGDKLLTKYFVKISDGFIAMSKSVLSDIDIFDTIKPRLLSPHPIFDNFGEKVPKMVAMKKLGLSDEFKYILFFGFIRDYKGLDLLIDAFADERFRTMPVKLIVAGEFYTDSQKYLELIEKYHLEESIILNTDFIPNEEVASYFCACDIVAQPYKTATQSGVTQIGFHFEKPMLVTNVGGLGEIIKPGKIGYVTAPSPGEIADALFHFFTSDFIDTFEANIKQEKKKYSWEQMYDNIIGIYNSAQHDHTQ